MVVRSCSGPVLLADVLPSYLCACMPARLLSVFAMFCPKHDEGATTWERLRVHLALGECDSKGRDGKAAKRYEVGNQCSRSIHCEKDQGWEEVSRLPEYLVTSPSFPRASSGRPRWPANTGWQAGCSLFLVQLT